MDAALWPALLERIADAFGAQEASLSGVTASAVPWIVAPRTDQDFLLAYRDHYHPLNLFWRHVSRLPRGTVATDRMVMTKRELHRSEFFNDWSEPQGYLAVMGSTLLVENGWRTEFVVPGKEDFGPEHLKLYKALAPHLVRAMQLTQRLANAETARAGFIEALDRLEQGVLLLDARARLVHANATAEALLAAGAGIHVSNGLVHCRSHIETTELHRLVAACAGGEIEDSGGRIAVTRAAGAAPLTLLCIRLNVDPGPFSALQPQVVVFISDPDGHLAARSRKLQQRFNLTAAEAAFALEIVKGDGRDAAARRRGISPATARTHLSNIFDKTGVRRQAELVRLLLGPD